MLRPFIPDKEISLSQENDLLKTGVYADNLTSVINATPKNEVTTIGVFGGWGTGKSSIIRTASEKVMKGNSKVKFITYDAWKYSNDSFRRMFLLKLQKELRLSQTPEMQRFYQSETAEQEPKTVLSVRGMVVVSIFLLIAAVILWQFPLKTEVKFGITSVLTFASLIFAMLNGCFYDLKLTINKPALFAPEQFEACFLQMMNHCLADRSWLGGVALHAKEFVCREECSETNLEKIVIVVDNMDRCPSDLAYQLLSDIKTFLSNEPICVVFIIPVDDEALKKHLFDRHGNNGADVCQEKEEFLRKFFNVTIRIKPHQEAELQHFTVQLNEQYHLNYNKNTLALASKVFASNPRRIIQLLNNLNSELDLYDEEFSKNYETTVLAVLVLKEEFYELYKKGLGDFRLLTNYKTEEKKDKEAAFMRLARNAFVSVPLQVLQRIFTNTFSIFADIPNEVVQASKTFGFEDVKAYVDANMESYDNVVSLCFENLKSDIKYQSESQMALWLDFFASFNDYKKFEAHNLTEINGLLLGYYFKVLPLLENVSGICNLAFDLAKQRMTQLKQQIFEYVIKEESNKNKNYNAFVKAVLTTFQSQSDCKSLNKFIKSFFADNEIPKDVEYSENQLQYLFDDEFVNAKIESIGSLGDDAAAVDVRWCLSNCIRLNSATYSALATRLVTLFGETRGKKFEDYLPFVESVKSYLRPLKDHQVHNELSPLYDKIVKPRSIPHPSYQAYPQHDSKRTIFEDMNQENAPGVVDCCFEFFRTSGGGINVANSIQKLTEFDAANIYARMVELYKSGIDIRQFDGLVLSIEEYNQDTLILTQSLFDRDSEGNVHITEEQAGNKIKSLLDNIDNEGVVKLVEELLKDDLCKNIITEEIASSDSEYINALPKSLSRFAVGVFTKENAEEFSDNFDYLAFIAKEGNTSQVEAVVAMMKKRLIDASEIPSVITVVENLQTRNKLIVKPLLEEIRSARSKYEEQSELTDRMDALISKFSDIVDEKKGLFKGKK